MADPQFENKDLYEVWKKIQPCDGGSSIYINVADFGILPDGNDYSVEIRQLIEDNIGNTIFFPEGVYVYDGVDITTTRVSIMGVRPKYFRFNDGFIDVMSLEDGTIFTNGFRFTGSHVSLQSFGVDLNRSLAANDGVVHSPDMTQYEDFNRTAYIKDVVCLSTDNSLPFHGILVENTVFCNIHINESHNFNLGLVVKSEGGLMSDNWITNPLFAGLFFRSDDDFGRCSNVICDGTKVESDSLVSNLTGLRLSSSGGQLEGMKITDTTIVNCGIACYLGSSGADGVGCNNNTVSGLTIQNANLFAILVEGNDKFMWQNQFSDVNATGISGRYFDVSGTNVRKISLSDAQFDVLGSTPQTTKDNIVRFAAGTRGTALNNILASIGYIPSTANNLFINYENSAQENNYFGITGLNPVGGVPEDANISFAVSAGNNSLVPVFSRLDYTSVIKLTGDVDGVVINDIEIETFPGVSIDRFKTGYRLIVQNLNSFDITIDANIAGHILLPNFTDVVVESNSVIVFYSTATFWQIEQNNPI